MIDFYYDFIIIILEPTTPQCPELESLSLDDTHSFSLMDPNKSIEFSDSMVEKVRFQFFI